MDASLAPNLTAREEPPSQTIEFGFFDQPILSLNSVNIPEADSVNVTRATGETILQNCFDVDDVTSGIMSMEDFFDFDDATLQSSLLPADANFLMLPHLGLNLSTNKPQQASNNTTRPRSAKTGPIRRNFQCPHCIKSYSRPSDRDRHALSHNPNASRYSCPAVGCSRVGNKGFLRKDKLAQNREHVGH